MKVTSKPFFTIGILTHNRVSYLKLAIRSVLRQSFKNYEILVIDNKSDDGTEAMMRTISNKHTNIIYIRNRIDNGGVISLNKLFYKARGKYLFILCDDDLILTPNVLSGVYRKIKQYRPGFVKLETLFYHEKIANIIKCFKFIKKNTQIKSNDARFIEKTFGKFIEFWSGSIFKLDTRLFHLINTKEWLYTSLDYIFSEIEKNGAFFTGDFCILGRYLGINDLTRLIEPTLSLDSYMATVKKYVNHDELLRLDNIVRKNSLLTIVNIKLYATTRQIFLYLYKVFKNDKQKVNKIHYYLYAIIVILIPKFVFVIFKKYIYHPILRKEAYTYIKNSNLSTPLNYWINYEKKHTF